MKQLKSKVEALEGEKGQYERKLRGTKVRQSAELLPCWSHVACFTFYQCYRFQISVEEKKNSCRVNEVISDL